MFTKLENLLKYKNHVKTKNVYFNKNVWLYGKPNIAGRHVAYLFMIQVVASTTDDVMTVTRATPSSRRRRTLYTARATLHSQCQRSSRGPTAPADRPRSSITSVQCVCVSAAQSHVIVARSVCACE